MQGSLAEGVLPSLLRELYVGRRTGYLRFVNEGAQAKVLFMDGQMVRAETNVGADRLGETLVKQGLLSPEDLERATAVVLKDKTRLGRALAGLGIMDREHLESALALHLRETLLKIFGWSEGTFDFEDTGRPSPADCDVTSKFSTGEMILEAVKQVRDPDVIRYALGNIDRVVGLSTDPLLRFQNVGLTPADGYVVSRIDGTTSIRELLQLIPMVPDDVLKSLFGLVSVGIVEFLAVPPKEPPRLPALLKVPPPEPAAPPPPPPPPTEQELAIAAHRQEVVEAYQTLKTKNHFEFLGIPRASSETQVKEAYFRMAKRYHPDMQREPALADLKDKMAAVFIRLGEAYEVLRKPETRSAYESDLVARAPRPFPQPGAEPAPGAPGDDPAREAKKAAELTHQAEKLMAGEQFWDAIQLLEQAVPLGTGRPRQRSRVLLATCFLRNPKWVHRAEEVLQTVLKEDPKYPEPYFILGTIYKGGGLKSRAVSMFRKVLELKPDHEAAMKELAGLDPVEPQEPPPPPESRGFLKKIFGKT
jgi:hypothetical protein